MWSTEKKVLCLSTLMVAILTMAVTGCSTPNTANTGGFDLDTGGHPAGWTSSHSGFVSSDAGECTPCHDASLEGGISMVSCLTSDCHHGTVPGWALPREHGAQAKTNSSSLGFISCQICHGADFSGGLTGMDCFLCHNTAPHPSNWRRGDTYVHTNTDEGNAPACAECHLDGNNSPIGAPPPAEEGTPPGCFNNTLCHGNTFGDTHGLNWLNSDVPASFHGSFVAEITCETSGCHPLPGHPTCTACHFDNQGSRVAGSFDHTGNVTSSHRSVSGQAGTVCENCHETSRTFRGGIPSCSGGGGSHPGNEGCHYDATALNPVLSNPRY